MAQISAASLTAGGSVNWPISIALFALGLIEGLFGYSLPDDELSGVGLRVFEGILQGIPVVGTYASYFLFGGPFPGTQIVARWRPGGKVGVYLAGLARFSRARQCIPHVLCYT